VDVPLPDIAAVTAAHWDKVLRLNLVGTFLVSQAALPLLRQAGDGWIINITSLAGVRQTGSSLPYAVSSKRTRPDIRGAGPWCGSHDDGQPAAG
jgi:ketoreductase RED2